MTLEPATWAVMLLGLFTVAGILRHWPKTPASLAGRHDGGPPRS